MDRGTHVLAVILVVLCVFAVSAEAGGEAKKKTKGKFFGAQGSPCRLPCRLFLAAFAIPSYDFC